MAKDLIKQSEEIILEADAILRSSGLNTVLKKYGTVHVTGSYSYKLMSFRDLDIYLESEDMTTEKWFQLGTELAEFLRPARMHYRNELIGKTPNLPQGYYWRIFAEVAGHEWNIDIWAMSSREVKTFLEIRDEVASRISDENRLLILETKDYLHTHPEVHIDSRAFYAAIFSGTIKSVDSLKVWLRDMN